MTLWMYNDESVLNTDPEVDAVAALYVMFLRAEVPKTVSLLTVRSSWALLVAGREHAPEGPVKAM